MSKLDQIVDCLPQLLPLPEAVARAVALIQDPRSSGSQVARVIETDQALAAKLLKLANSAFYTTRRPAASVEEALLRVGFSITKGMLLSAAAWCMLEARDAIGPLSARRLWRHSVATAFCARRLVSLVGGCRLEETYTAGLLHDLGSLAIAQYAPDGLAEALRVATRGLALFEAEREVLGFDHAEVGARLLAAWGLPDSSVEAARWHHTPTRPPSPGRLVLVAHVADSLSHLVGSYAWPQLDWHPVDREAVESLGLGVGAVYRVVGEARSGLDGVEQLLGLASTATA